MEWICRNNHSANESREIYQTSCQIDFFNTTISFAFAYIYLLIFIYLNCSRGIQQSQKCAKKTATLLDIRGLLELLLFLVHFCELGEAILSQKRGDFIDVLLPISAIVVCFSEIYVHVRFRETHRCRYFLLSISLWILTSMGRIFRLYITYVGIKEKDNWENCLRIYSTSLIILTAATLILIDLGLIYIQLQYNYSKDTSEEEFEEIEENFDENISVISKLTFWWLTPLLWHGYQEALEMEDIKEFYDEKKTHSKTEEFKKIYFEEKEKNSPIFLWKCYIRFCRTNFVFGGILKFISDSLTLVGPLGISVIIIFVSKITQTSPENIPPTKNRLISVEEFLSNGFVMATIVFIAAVIQGVLSQYGTHLVNLDGIHLKVALQSLIYEKALRLVSWDLSKKQAESEQKRKKSDLEPEPSTEVGLITNLITEDTFNIMSFIWIGHYTWAIPLKISVLIYLLYLKLGLSAVIGATFCIITMSPLQFWIGKHLSANSKNILEASDVRLRAMNEILQGIKIIKLSAWEKLHEERISKIRNEELKYLNKDSFYWAIMTFLTHTSPILITLITFGTFFLIESRELTPQDVFAGLVLINQLTVPLFIFPVIVPIIINAIVSSKRIRGYLDLPEIADKTICKNNKKLSLTAIGSQESKFGLQNIHEDSEHDFDDEEMVVVAVKNAKFYWGRTFEESYSLTVGDLKIPRGKLTVVVGKIGSGKSSLLSALLGEIYMNNGCVNWSSDISVAYISQTIWLVNGSIRENIIFGKPFRERYYQRIINACALSSDLELLPDKDLTEVGEKGVHLSGGQKQRIAIARALYSAAKVVIMDDSFSALDQQVVQHVFENGIQKLLLEKQKRTVVLVTHQLQLLRFANKIIVIENGEIRAQSSSLKELEQIDATLVQEWNEISTKSRDQIEKHTSRTAKERWHLLHLMSRIGNRLRKRNSVQGATWKAILNEQTPHYRPLEKKRPSSCSLYGSHFFNFLPLTSDECGVDTELDYSGEDRMIRRQRSCVINRKISSIRCHKTAKRTASLQTNRTRDHSAVVRQYSSPIVQLLPLKPVVTSIDNSDDEIGNLNKTFNEKANEGKNLLKPRESLKRTWSNISKASSIDELEENYVNYQEDNNEYSVASEEERRYGMIPKKIFVTYMKACSYWFSLSYLFLALIWQAIKVFSDFWLSHWMDKDQDNDTKFYLVVYSVISISSIVISLFSNVLAQFCGAIGRRCLHDKFLKNVLRFSMDFFETTPIGHVLNRYATDLAIIDKKIIIAIQRLVQVLFVCTSAIFVNALVTPWFVIMAIPVCLIYYIIQKFFRSSSRELQRLDNLTRAPILAHFSETLNGLSTIRAFGQKARFSHTMQNKLDAHTNSFLILNTSNRWLGISLDFLGAFIVLVAILTCLITAQQYPRFITPALVGLAINYTLLIPVYLTWVVKFVADVEMHMSAVDRVIYYIELPAESKENSDERCEKVDESWPKHGDIELENVSIRYYQDQDPVIKELSLKIFAGQKIGICGRTGSGKSTLILSLFGMVKPSEGRIKIANIDLSQISLSKLRSRLSIITQEVIMFGGTVRDNIDPYHQFSDSQIWQCLELAQSKEWIVSNLGGLEGTIAEGGSNLSVGEKQLLCLARACLHEAPVLVMDEATSSVDLATESALLNATQNAFPNSTVIIVAHRLQTILSCDRIIILDGGRIVADDTPQNLQKESNGIFKNLLQQHQEFK